MSGQFRYLDVCIVLALGISAMCLYDELPRVRDWWFRRRFYSPERARLRQLEKHLGRRP